MTGYPRSGNSLTAAQQILTATLTFAVTCGRSCVPLAVEPEVSPLEWVPHAGPSRRPRCRHRAHSTPAAHRRRRFAHRSGHSRSTAPAVLLMVASPLEYPRPAAGPSRRPRPTGRCRHRAHGTPAAHCRRRFAHRSGHSRSTASGVLLMVTVHSSCDGTGIRNQEFPQEFYSGMGHTRSGTRNTRVQELPRGHHGWGTLSTQGRPAGWSPTLDRSFDSRTNGTEKRHSA